MEDKEIKNYDEVINISNSLASEHVATCDKCLKEKKFTNMDGLQVAIRLHEEGWKILEDQGMMFCPKCLK